MEELWYCNIWGNSIWQVGEWEGDKGEESQYLQNRIMDNNNNKLFYIFKK